MKNILSYRRTLTLCAVVLTLISIRMHVDPAGITENEFPYAQDIYKYVEKAETFTALAGCCE